jgi:hypothetical protein
MKIGINISIRESQRALFRNNSRVRRRQRVVPPLRHPPLVVVTPVPRLHQLRVMHQ